MNENFEMRDFGTYSPEEVIAENLRELTERADVLCEQEIAHLCELATEIAEGDDLADLLSSLPYYRISVAEPLTDVLANHTELLYRSRKLLEARQCMILCRALYEKLQHRENLLSALFPDVEEPLPQAAGRIVYQRSSYANDAYLAFASLLLNARATYAHSFAAACEEVYNGHCEYCILPVENAVEGELIGFAKLIAQFDLKIIAVCDIAGADASRSTRFALLQRNMLPLFRVDAEKRGCLRISLPKESAAQVADILSAANFYGLKFRSANTLPLSERTLFNLTFDICGGDLYPFLLYLATVAPQYTPIGIYSHIKQKGI